MTREEAMKIACAAAIANPEKYVGTGTDFVPHEWVIKAILCAANYPKSLGPPQPLPCGCTTFCEHKKYPSAPLRNGLYCREQKARGVDDAEFGMSEHRPSTNEIINVFNADAEDAAKWRALRGSARITAVGSAGLGTPWKGNYAHVTLNFWNIYPEGGDDGGVGAAWLDKYVELTRKVQEMVKPV